MFFIGLGTATPERCYTQRECWEAFSQSELSGRLSARSRAIVRKVLNGNNGIETRHLALEPLEEAFALTPDDLHARFLRHAPALAAQAVERALSDAEVKASEIDAILISTCTGYLCPGLTSYVSERVGLGANVIALDLVGQGCGAALPNLRTAEALLKSGKASKVVSCCVEVCSAALYFDDDGGVLISACLFGDGAGAAVLSNEPSHKRRIEWKTSRSLTAPADRDLLRFEQRHGMLRNILTPQVPELAAKHAKEVFARTIGHAGADVSRISGWVLHPGGRDVLAALRSAFDLRNGETRWSEAVLRSHGNLSSPSVFFVLEAALKDSAPSGYWWMSSFGAGFSCHGALLKVK